MRRLEKERVPDLFVATTKKKQFYVFSEASVNRGSLFISADVEKFIIRFSSLGFLLFRTTGFDKRSSFTYKAQSYKRLVYLDLRILLLRFLNGCNLPVFYKKKKKKNFIRNCQELRFSRTNVRFFLFSYLSCETRKQKGSTSF